MATTMPGVKDVIAADKTDGTDQIGDHAAHHDKLADVVNVLQDQALASIITVTTDTTAAMANDLIKVNAAGGNVTIRLPTVVGWVKSKPLFIKKIDSSANTVTVQVASGSGQLIDSQSSQTISLQFQALGVLGDSAQTEWSLV